MNSAVANFRRLPKLLLAVVLLCAQGLASAQVPLPPPNVLLTEPNPALLTFGPVDIHGRVTSSFVYDDNISLYEHETGLKGPFNTAGRNQPPLGDDFIFTFSPGIIVTKPTTLADSRSTFSVDYAPAFIFFMENEEENSVDHRVKADGGYAFTKLTLGVSQEFENTAGGVVDVGSRVSQNRYQTVANARYEMSEKTYLQLDGSFRITDYQTLTDSEEWSVTPTANYQISPKVTLGIGLTFGQLLVDEQVTHTNAETTNIVIKTDRQSYMGPTFRASYKTSEKTDISLSVGGEWRWYSDDSTSFGPVFSLVGAYRPFEGTSFTLEGHRREQNSAVINGANFIATGGSISVRQRLRDRLFGTFSATYDHSDYEPYRDDVEVTRQDDYYLLRTGLEAILGRSWTIGIFHQYREDISNDKSFSFSNNQVGIQAAWGR